MDESHHASGRRPLLMAGLVVYSVLAACSLGALLTRANLLHPPDALKLWLNLAYGYWVAVSFVLAQVGVGWAVFRLPHLRQCEASPSVKTVFMCAVGAYASYCVLMLLGAFKLLNGLGFSVYLLSAIGFSGVGLLSWLRRTGAERVTPEPVRAPIGLRARWGTLALVAGLIWALPYLAQTLLPNTDWDSASHHLPIAKAYMEQGIWTTDEAYPAYNYPGAVHLFYSLFFFLGAESGIIPLNFISCAGIILGVYALTTHLWGRSAGTWAAAICLSNNILWEVGLTARIDTFLAWFCLLAVGALLLWLRERDQAGWLMVGGMMLGLALGTKYTAGVFLGVLGAAVLIMTLRGPGRTSARRVAPLLLGIALAAFPSLGWYARNAAALGDPLYQFLRGPVYRNSSGQTAQLKPALTAAVEKGLASPGIQRALGMLPERGPQHQVPKTLFNLYDVLVHSERHTRRPLHFITPFLFLFFLFPLFRRDRLSLWIYVVGCSTFALIAAQSHLLRYALPVIPLLSIGAGLCLSRVRWRVMVVLLGALLASVPLYASLQEWRKLASEKPLAYWSGQSDRVEWLMEIGYNGMIQFPSVIRQINTWIDEGAIPRDATLFMLGESKGNLLQCRHLPDGSRYGQRWVSEILRTGGDYDELARDFEERGIRYFVWNDGYLGWSVLNTSVRPEEVAFSLYHFGQFLQRHIEQVRRIPGMGLGKLKQDRPSDGQG